MALKNLFDMVKADRYTADGREALIKAQEAEIEDKVYQIGEISQKTGLQKTANGWVKPKSGKQPGAKKQEEPKNVHGAEVDKIYERQLKRIKELKAKGFTDEQIDNDKIIKQTKEDMKNVGKKPESKPAAENKTTIRQGPNTKTLNETPAEHVQKNLDAYKGYQPYDMEELVLKPSGYKKQTSARVPGGGQSITYTKNGAEDITLFFDKNGELENADVAGSKPDAAAQRDQIGGEIKGNLEAAKYYFDKAQSFSPTDPSYKTYMTKAKQYNDEAKAQADDNGFDFEEMHNAGITQSLNHYAKEQETKPTKTYKNEEGRRNFKAALDDNPKSRYDFAKTVEFAVPMSQDDKIELRKLQMFMSDEGTDYKQALRSRASNLVDGNKSNGDWFPEKEKSIMKIAKAVGYDKELHKFIEEEYKGYDLGYSEDAAPRVLTGDTRIRVRKA